MDSPKFAPAPPLRCALKEHLSMLGLPFRSARWRAPGNVAAPWVAVCDHHRRPLDVQVGADEPVLRVVVELRAELAGRLPDVAASRSEAIEALQTALAAIGARLEVVSVTSDVVRPAPLPSPSAQKAAVGVQG